MSEQILIKTEKMHFCFGAETNAAPVKHLQFGPQKLRCACGAVFLAHLNEVQEELLHYPSHRQWHRCRKKGEGRGDLRGEVQYTLYPPPPSHTHTQKPTLSFNFYVKQEKSQMYQVEGTGKTIPQFYP